MAKAGFDGENCATNSAGTPAATTWVGISWIRRSAKSVPPSVNPTVPPICWKNVRLLVATPIRAGETAFWTISVKTASDGPIPSPARTIHSQRIGRSVSARRFVIRNRATARSASEPTIRNL